MNLQGKTVEIQWNVIMEMIIVFKSVKQNCILVKLQTTIHSFEVTENFQYASYPHDHHNHILIFMFNQIIKWSVGYLISGLFDQLISWSVDQLISWSVEQLSSWAVEQLSSLSVDKFIIWLINQLIIWFVIWSI